MADQASLFGTEAPAQLTDRFFFALFPDAEVAEQIAQVAGQLRGKLGLKGRPLQTARFHITLHHLGDYAGMSKSVVDDAVRAASTLTAAPFDVCFDRAESFASMPRNRPFVLRTAEGDGELMRFQQSLGQAMKRTPLGRWAKPGYTPHVTLLYDDMAVPNQPVPDIRWTVREFVLVRSLLGETRHERLASWPLIGN